MSSTINSHMSQWLYLLGAGASVDSGLVTYRGPKGINVTNKNITSEKSFIQLEKLIKSNSPGATYEIINNISPKDSMIITQNIDGYAHSTNLEVIDIHLHEGYDLTYKNIVKIGERLPNKKVMVLNRFINKKKPKYMIVIGTSLQFDYLRAIINKAKGKGSKIIHINPDEDYKYNINKNEYWLKMTSYDGLSKLNECIYEIENGAK